MSEATDPYAMTWTKHPWDFEGKRYTEWRGASEYHSATVTNFPGDGKTWRATVAGYPYDQHSPYYRTVAGAKGWAGRYGRPRAARKRASRPWLRDRSVFATCSAPQPTT